MDELSTEDSLRLNVLLASKPLAIRIQESRLLVQGLTTQGEREVSLNPNCREDLYLRRVRELISGQVLGSPGGYPVYLKRWTRMGQMRDESLEQLLLLGEPEAVVAAVSAPGLSDELARRAWWCLEDAGNARRMLANPKIRSGQMGPVLARYLLEHLPFESEPEVMMETARLVLQEGIIDAAERLDLWKKSARKSAYLVGFMLSRADEIPLSIPASQHLPLLQTQLDQLADNSFAQALARLLDAPGQAFLQTFELVLKKPANQEVVVGALSAVQRYLAELRPAGDPDLSLEQLAAEAETALEQNPQLRQCQQLLPQLRAQWLSLYQLSGLGYAILRPYLGDSTAIGSLMRRKLEPAIAGVEGLLAQMK
ncbi:MAG: sulfur reduction protein DsrS [Gammaproteobacteria bacterium]|nr:sulfur reduction protein DsrS [Gammaproteobacteria bacterium]